MFVLTFLSNGEGARGCLSVFSGIKALAETSQNIEITDTEEKAKPTVKGKLSTIK